MKRLIQAPNTALAHLWAAQLRAAGFDVSVQREFAGGIAGEIPVDQALPEIWIMDENQFTVAGDPKIGFAGDASTGEFNCFLEGGEGIFRGAFAMPTMPCEAHGLRRHPKWVHSFSLSIWVLTAQRSGPAGEQ